MDPAYLALISANPRAGLAALRLDDATRSQLHDLDWSRVRHFAGFITKVQHNDLWPVLPYTRAMLKAYRFEIEFFARYRPTYLRRRASGATRDQRISSFLRFLEAEISPSDYPGLRDVARHEEARWLAEAAAHTTGDGADPGAGEDLTIVSRRESLRLVPFVRGFLRVAAFETDPEASIQAIKRGQFGRGSIAQIPRWLGYWVDPCNDRVRLMELDGATSRVLAEIDGRRSIGTLIRRSRASAPVTRGVLEAAQAQGLIGLARSRRTEAQNADRFR